MPVREEMPYRDCVGVAVFNAEGKVFVGRRKPEGNPEHVTVHDSPWQMPQGGIDKGEDPYEAALRELYEETSIRSVKKLGEIEDWLTYDIPGRIVGQAWRGKFRGQTQKWFAFAFTGDEGEIEILKPGGGHHKAEFMAWRWESLDRAPELVVPFKRPVYERVAKEFRRFTV